MNQADTRCPLNPLRRPEVDASVPLEEHVFYASQGRVAARVFQIASHDDRMADIVILLQQFFHLLSADLSFTRFSRCVDTTVAVWPGASGMSRSMKSIERSA